jgi:hypothetical protein
MLTKLKQLQSNTIAVLRQVLAGAISLYGLVNAIAGAYKLPAAVSAVLVATYPVLMTVEHYLAGSSTTSTSAVQKAAAQGKNIPLSHVNPIETPVNKVV